MLLVDVKVMRHDGQRIPRERLAAIPVQRGQLVIDRRRGTRGDTLVPVAKLVLPGMDTWSLPALEEVRVLRWRGIDIVLTGIEHIGRPKQARAQQQSWWVRLVID